MRLNLEVIEVISAVATVLALVWAVAATVKTRRDMLAETRRQFDLNLLAEMWKVLCETRNAAALQGYVGALIRDRNNSPDLPMLRAYLGVKPDSAGQELLRGMDLLRATDPEFIEAVQFEVDEAINRRIPGGLK